MSDLVVTSIEVELICVEVLVVPVSGTIVIAVLVVTGVLEVVVLSGNMVLQVSPVLSTETLSLC